MTLEKQAKETLLILQRGWYTTAGLHVTLASKLERARNETRLYMPEEVLPALKPGGSTMVTIANEPTIAATARFTAQGKRVLALNFASAKRPGGGWLTGANAQEESLMRASGLYKCIQGSPFYENVPNAFYTSRVIYSPDVPVFRDEKGRLLDDTYPCSFLTCAAVNRGALRDVSGKEVAQIMAERIWRLLHVGAGRGYEVIILGAFGCGVFANDPWTVATLFSDALTNQFKGVFPHAHFAILDPTDSDCIYPFRDLFGVWE